MRTLRPIIPFMVISLIITTSCTKETFEPSKEITTEIKIDELPPFETIYHIPASNIEMKEINTKSLWPTNTDQEDMMPIEELNADRIHTQRLELQDNPKKSDFRFRWMK